MEGLRLNASKTVALTNEALSSVPQKVQVENGKPGHKGHKWLGAILCVGLDGRTLQDVSYRLEAASSAFFFEKAYAL